MIKKLITLCLLITLFACDSDKGLNCFQSVGNIIQTEVTVESFSKIIVWERAQLIIEQGPVQKVIVETGENLLNDIEVFVEDNRLNIKNNNGCNLVRDYGITKIFVTTPNVSEIRNSSGLPVESIGVLNLPELTLLTEDLEKEDEFHKDGDFILNLDVETLVINTNGLAKYFLEGSATDAEINVFDQDGRIFAENLIVQNLTIFHRGTGDITVNPQQSIIGKIVSLGDVISKTRPPIVDVEQPYRGRLIFE